MCVLYFVFFFFNDTATTEIYTLSLHDALPISRWGKRITGSFGSTYTIEAPPAQNPLSPGPSRKPRSEEHTSELQSHVNLVCRLLLEKKKKKTKTTTQLTRTLP